MPCHDVTRPAESCRGCTCVLRSHTSSPPPNVAAMQPCLGRLHVALHGCGQGLVGHAAMSCMTIMAVWKLLPPTTVPLPSLPVQACRGQRASAAGHHCSSRLVVNVVPAQSGAWVACSDNRRACACALPEEPGVRGRRCQCRHTQREEERSRSATPARCWTAHVLEAAAQRHDCRAHPGVRGAAASGWQR